MDIQTENGIVIGLFSGGAISEGMINYMFPNSPAANISYFAIFLSISLAIDASKKTSYNKGVENGFGRGYAKALEDMK